MACSLFAFSLNHLIISIIDLYFILKDYALNGSTFLAVLFVCFVALRPKSTAMVIAGQSVHLTTLFPGQA